MSTWNKCQKLLQTYITSQIIKSAAPTDKKYKSKVKASFEFWFGKIKLSSSFLNVFFVTEIQSTSNTNAQCRNLQKSMNYRFDGVWLFY